MDGLRTILAKIPYTWPHPSQNATLNQGSPPFDSSLLGSLTIWSRPSIPHSGALGLRHHRFLSVKRNKQQIDRLALGALVAAVVLGRRLGVGVTH